MKNLNRVAYKLKLIRETEVLIIVSDIGHISELFEIYVKTLEMLNN